MGKWIQSHIKKCGSWFSMVPLHPYSVSGLHVLRTEINSDINFLLHLYSRLMSKIFFWVFLFSGILNLFFFNIYFIFKIGSVYHTCLTDSSLKHVFIRSKIAVQVDYWLQLISGNRRFQSIRLIPQDWLYHLSFRIPQPIPDCQGSRSLSLWLLLHKFSYIMSAWKLPHAVHKDVT